VASLRKSAVLPGLAAAASAGAGIGLALRALGIGGAITGGIAAGLLAALAQQTIP
jgi:hypothetical protein